MHTLYCLHYVSEYFIQDGMVKHYNILLLSVRRLKWLQEGGIKQHVLKKKTYKFHSFRCFAEELSEGNQDGLGGESRDGFRLQKKTDMREL